MQTVVQVVCTRGRSLREQIADSRKLESHSLELVKQKQVGRSPGWLKVRSTNPERRGALNIEWNKSTAVLTCRVVSRGARRPHLIIGDFLDYLFRYHAGRLRFVTVIPDRD